MRVGASDVGKWLFAVVVPASGLALGSIPTPVLFVVTVAAALSTALLWIDPVDRLSRSTKAVLAVAALLVLMTMVQCIPVPAGVVRLVAPVNADIWERSLRPFQEAGPGWHPFSIAPLATRVEVLRGAFYVCVFLGALRIASLEHGAKFLERMIVIAAVVMAISALAHPAFAAQKLFGIYRPRHLYAYKYGYYAPLLNTNHLAAYLNIGLCIGLDLLTRSRPAFPRSLGGAMVLVLAGTSIWAGSRGGMGSLAVGVLFTIVLGYLARRRYGRLGGLNAAFSIALLVAAGVLIGLGASETARDDLANTDLSKFEVARRALHLVPLSPVMGFGRGAFEDVFPRVRESTLYMTSTNPENILAQWLSEWGVPVAAIAFALLAWALRPKVLFSAVRPAVGAWVAIVITVLHDLVDFHLEVPGVVALVTVCAAIVVAGRRARDEAPRRAFPWLRRGVWATCSATALIGCFVVLSVRSNLDEDRTHLSAIATDHALSNADFRAELRAAMLRHPAEAFLPLMGAVRAQANDLGRADESVAGWVGAALERDPHFGRAHFVLARSLAKRGATRAQARLEYRLAFAEDRGLREAILAEAPRLVGGVDDALALVPDGPAGLVMLTELSPLLASRLPATADVLDRETLRRDPRQGATLLRAARASRSDVTHQHPWCAGTSCTDAAFATATAAVDATPNECEPHLLVARARVDRGERSAALDELARTADTVERRVECKKSVLRLAEELGETGRVDALIEEISRAGCGTRDQCAELFGWLGVVEEERRHDVRALYFFKRALEANPEHDDVLAHMADVAARRGFIGDAITATTTLARRHPEDPKWAARLMQLRRAQATQLATPPAQ